MRFAIVVVAAGLAMGQTVLTRVAERAEIYPTAVGSLAAPLWNGNFLMGQAVNQSPEPVLWTMDRSGRKEEIRFTIPDAASIIVRGMAGSADGAIAAAGSATSNGAAYWGFVCVIPANRGASLIIRDEIYRPLAVTMTPDGVIWTIGTQTQDKKVFENVLKRYSATGKLLTSQVVAVPGATALSSQLRSARDRVGWLTSDGAYFEFALDGHQINRFPKLPVDPKVTWNPPSTVALNDNLEVIGQSGSPAKLWSLDRVKRGWNPVSIAGEPMESSPMIFGFDGDQLVVGAWDHDRGFLIVHLSAETR